MQRDDEEFVCPVCGEEVHAGALACPHCGADERSGWREDAHEIDAAGGAGIQDPDDFDYDRFVEEEFGGGARPRSGREKLWVWVAILILAAFVAAYVVWS